MARLMEDPVKKQTVPPGTNDSSIEVSVIIPAFNESQFIGQTLRALRNTAFPNKKFEVIVVDNGSTDTTVSIAEPLADIVSLLPEGNVGAVRNHGVTLASGRYLIFIDADCTVEQDWLNQAYSLASKQNGETIYGGVCKVSKNANWIERLWLLDGKKRYQKDLTGACIVISRANFDFIGGFNEQVTSGEDTDLSQRLKGAGKAVKVCPEFYVTHLGNADTIKKFIKRQAWHGENYFSDIRASLKDPTFLLCCLAIAILTLCLTLGILRNWAALPFALTLFLIPSIFSAKRMLYAKYFPKNPVNLFKIYILDSAYVLGRCLGIVKSITQLRTRFT